MLQANENRNDSLSSAPLEWANRVLGASENENQDNTQAPQSQMSSAGLETMLDSVCGGDFDFKDVQGKPANSIEVKNALKQIFIFTLFMVIYTWVTTRDLNNQQVFNFGESLRRQLIEVEFMENRPGIKFQQLSSVAEFYQFLSGPLVETVFSPDTFDGDDRWNFQEGEQGGTALGYSSFIGAVRISQLRTKKADCSSDVSPILALPESKVWSCYAAFKNDAFGQTEFDVSREETTAFGTLAGWSGKAFPYNGRNGFTGDALGTSVAAARDQWFSNFYSDEYVSYPSPAFAITLDTHKGADAAREVLAAIQNASYIDLHTKAVFVDMQLYNPMLDRVCWFRLVAEMGDFGGVQPSYELGVVKPWESKERNNRHDRFFYGLYVLVTLFYSFYFLQEGAELYLTGRKYWFKWINLFQLANIFVFTGSMVLRFVIEEGLLPDTMNVGSDAFYDLAPIVKAIHRRRNLEACCVWMNWFRVVPILSLSSTFRVMVLTLETAGKQVAGFAVVFGAIMYGFTQAHAMVFGTRVAGYRTMTQSAFSLIRGLMGDVDYDRLQEADPWMAPMFFTLFNTLAVFVVLNMLIAIITDAYMTTAAQMKDQEGFELVSGMAHYIHDLVLSAPVVGGWLKQGEQAITKRKSVIEHSVANFSVSKIYPGSSQRGEAAKKLPVPALGKFILKFRKYEDQFMHGGKGVNEGEAESGLVSKLQDVVGGAGEGGAGKTANHESNHESNRESNRESNQKGSECQCARLETVMNSKFDSIALQLKVSQEQNNKLLEMVAKLSARPDMFRQSVPLLRGRPQLLI